MSSQKPIRIALIGLSQSAKTSWASQAHLPYLNSPRGQERYKIVALLNSSVDAAKKAIAHYNLGPDVKAYGSPADLAKDDNVDLVVCTTRVDVHYDTVRPSLEAGKSAFVEWPLAENAQRARELTDLAKQKGVRTVIGLQARVAPPIVKVKQLIEQGVIGRVVSSEIQAATLFGGGDTMSEGLAYFLEKKVGGNPITIANGHMIDYVHYVLGEYEYFHSHTQIQRPHQSIVNQAGEVVKSVESNVPDLLSIHGTLVSSQHVVSGASLVVNFRSGPPFPGTLPLIWTIVGEKGNLRVTSERGPFINSESSGSPIPIEVFDAATGKTRNIDWQWETWQEDLPTRSKNIAKVYDLYFEGAGEKEGLVDFEGATKRHAELDKVLH